MPGNAARAHSRRAPIALVRDRSTASSAPRVSELLLGRQWAMMPERLQGLRSLLAQNLANPQALTAWMDAPVPDTFLATQRDGIATLRITGPLERTWSFWAWLFGSTTYDILAPDIQRLRDDAAVRAVILEFDTPGGDVHGTGELAAMIRAADSVKPFVAHVAGVGASAGYWLASSTRRIHVDPAAVVGSIGVIATFIDTSGWEEQLGVEFIEMVSTQSPRKGMDPTTKQGRADWQQLLDSLADVFIADVAAYRDVDVDTVLADFGQGGVFVGEEAMDAGLADALGTHDDVHAELLAELDSPSPDSNSEADTMPVNASTRSRAKASRTTSARVKAENARLRARARAEEDEADDEEEDDDEEAPANESESEMDDEEDEDDEEEGDGKAKGRGKKKAKAKRKSPAIDAAWVRANAPAAAAEIATAERERILGIHGLGAKVPGPKGQKAIVAGMQDPAATKQTVATALLESGAATGVAALNARQADEQDLDAPSNADDGNNASSDEDRAVQAILSAGKPKKR